MELETIIKQLEKVRDDLGLSQEKMARKLDVALRTYVQWIQGQSDPSARNLLKIQELIREHENGSN